MIFVHGGPRGRCSPAYHYMQFYHWAYALNQWLASQGYVVMSINYRSGVGYGRTFRTGAEHRSARQLRVSGRASPARNICSRGPMWMRHALGIWGLSYGGLLTSQALARNSDMFVAGVDLAGVHLYGQSLADTALSYKSSAISAIDRWKSPVFLLQGDDDRNVDFSQMVGLVQLLRAHDVYYELTVIPDDQHESMIHTNWVDDVRQDGRLPPPVRLGKTDADFELILLSASSCAAAIALAMAAARGVTAQLQSISARADNDAFNFWKPAYDRPDEEYTSGVRGTLVISARRVVGALAASRCEALRDIRDSPCATHEFSLGQDIYTGKLVPGDTTRDSGHAAERGWLYLQESSRLHHGRPSR